MTNEEAQAEYIEELEQELRFVRQQLDAQVKAFNEHSKALTARIVELSPHLQNDRRFE